MCSHCYDEMDFLPKRGSSIILGTNIFCAGVYEKNLQKLIRGLKYHNQRDLAYFQAKFMFEYWQNIAPERTFQVVPVPLYKKREKKRKYNHMTLVAEEFCKLSGYQLNTALIKRVKDTAPQYKLKRNERMKNLSKAFEIDETKLLEGDILIIDDICTTGSTFESMIEEFHKCGIKNITCFATTKP